jgi:hypothetical protein
MLTTRFVVSGAFNRLRWNDTAAVTASELRAFDMLSQDLVNLLRRHTLLNAPNVSDEALDWTDGQ